MQEDLANVDLLDLEDSLEDLVMMLSAIPEKEAKMVNLEDLGGLERMAHLENLAIMVVQEKQMT